MITPESYIPFRDEEEYRAKCVRWGLISDKAKTVKKEFIYKGADREEPATLVGYLESVFAVIKLASGRFYSIHPAFLKEMQAAKFVYPTYVSTVSGDDEQTGGEPEEIEEAPATPIKRRPTAKPVHKPVVLPDGRVTLDAVIDRFDTKYDPFAEGDQEVIIFRDVSWGEEPPANIMAWSNYSATLKKAELSKGDRVSLQGKLAEKKFDNEIRVKINNAAKIEKA